MVFVVVESVYSMDGDLAPLDALVSLCKKYKAYLIIDEAHASGVLGPQGRGLVCQLGLEKEVWARTVTFGKAFGVQGALFLGNQILKDYLCNFCVPFIYTTALSPFTLTSIGESVKFLRDDDSNLRQLHSNRDLFNEVLGMSTGIDGHPAPIYSFIFGSGEKAKAIAAQLAQKGLWANAILSPTVRQGTERLRICLHAFNCHDDILCLASHFKGFL